jgi:hypothetical protein
MPLLRSPSPPRLPDPDAEAPNSFRALLGVLRIYFAQLQASVTTLLGPRGGAFLGTLYGEYRLLASQTAGAANTAYTVPLDTTVLDSGMSRASNQITVTQSGVYHIDAALQFSNSDTQLHRVSVWKRVNGADVADSRADYSIPAQHGGAPGRLAVALARLTSLTANSTVELRWSTESTQVQLEALPTAVSPTRPAGAAVCVTVTFVSALAT